MAEPASPQYPPQPRKKRGCLWAALIAAGAFLLFGFAGCVALVAGVDSENTGSGGAEEETGAAGAEGGEDNEAGEEEEAAGVGDTVEDGELAFTVTDVETGVQSIGDEFIQETPQGQYVIVSLTVENTGTEPETFDGSDQKLFDADGSEHSHEDAAELYLDGADSFFENVNPGNELETKLVFDIPESAEPASIELRGSIFSSGGATVSLN